MAAEKPPSIILPPPLQTSRHVSPSPHGLRQRPLGRSTTFAEGNPQFNRRRSSFLSETFSETRKSLRSTTDDLLFPRLTNEDDIHNEDDGSHWHSLPLGLALLPAVGGLFFKNGSAVITDITLIILAAIFMNWAIRSPWEWYRSAQSMVTVEPTSPTVFTPIDEVDEDNSSKLADGKDRGGESAPKFPLKSATPEPLNAETASAQKELRLHELLALFSCFASPLMAAWLLHAIRSQLSRPSEGLVSDYNLTIFILVAEVRPLSHLIKLVQKRTLFLQRRLNIESLRETKRVENHQLLDVSRRLEELEAHVSDRIASTSTQKNTQADEALTAKASAQATSDVKRTVQPELDALNRAMRRYEKRTTVSSVQTEARLQDLEARLNDVVALAGAAQRNADRRPNNYIVTLTNWICAVVVIPVQYLLYVSRLPGRALASVVAVPTKYFLKRSRTQATREGKAPRRNLSSRSRERERRPKGPS